MLSKNDPAQKAIVLDMISSELERIQNELPQFVSGYEGIAFIRKEYDELWGMIKANWAISDMRFNSCVKIKSVQLAAMAVRLILDLGLLNE